MQAGQQITLLAGRYFVGNLKLSTSGTETKPIQITGAPGETVVIDGAEPNPPVWKPVGGNGLYITTTSATNPNLVLADGVRLYPHQTLDDLVAHKITVGIKSTGFARFDAVLDGFYRNPSTNPILNKNWRSPNTLYVKFRDGTDPADKQMIITSQRNGLTIAGQAHVQLRNLRFAHYGLAPAPTALSLADCSNVLLEHCTFEHNDIGVAMQGNCRNITVQGCEFYDSMKGWNAWKVKATYDNFVPYSSIFPYYARMLERGGLLYQHGFSGRGIVVRRCKFHDFAQAGHLGPASMNQKYKDSYEIDFHNNTVWNCVEDGFELDADARNVRVWHNVFHHCNAAISMAVARGGPTYIVRNIFHSITPDLFTIVPEDGLKTQPGHPFKTQTGDMNSRIGDVFFVHNTVDAPGESAGIELISPAQWKRFYARNNLVVVDRGPAVFVRSFAPYPVDLDYNGYFSKRGLFGSADRNTRDRLPSSQLRSLADFRRLGWEKHGVLGDPQFVNAREHDYRLQRGSRAIDRGVVIHGLNDGQFHGRSPDLGAMEFRN